ncbi:hypothetical protein D3C85_1049650 [compost metagenome]
MCRPPWSAASPPVSRHRPAPAWRRSGPYPRAMRLPRPGWGATLAARPAGHPPRAAGDAHSGTHPLPRPTPAARRARPASGLHPEIARHTASCRMARDARAPHANAGGAPRLRPARPLSRTSPPRPRSARYRPRARRGTGAWPVARPPAWRASPAHPDAGNAAVRRRHRHCVRRRLPARPAASPAGNGWPAVSSRYRPAPGRNPARHEVR